MNEQTRAAKEKPQLLNVVIACLVVLFFAPVISASSPADANLLEYALKLAICGAASAWLFREAGWLWGSLSVLPVLLPAYLMSGGSFFFILPSLLYLPLGVTLALVSKDKLSRAAAVGISAAIGTVVLLGLCLIPTYLSQGVISFSALETQYTSFFRFLRENMEKSFVISVLGTDVSFVTDANASLYAKQLVSMAPTLLGVAFMIIGYFSSWIYKTVLQFSRSPLPSPQSWRLQPSIVSAATLLLAVVVFLLGELLPLYLQIGLISPGLFLLPGFCIAGFSSIFAIRMVDGLPHPRILRPLLLFFVTISTGLPGFIGITAIFGIIDCIRAALPAKRDDAQP